MDRAQLERAAIFEPRGVNLERVQQLAQARAELLRRDREYTEEQERSRREFETARAQRQMDHAAALASRQLSAATAVANATKWAVWAAGFSAAGAVVTAIVEVIRLVHGK
jgi:hypothetical protein